MIYAPTIANTKPPTTVWDSFQTASKIKTQAFWHAFPVRTTNHFIVQSCVWSECVWFLFDAQHYSHSGLPLLASFRSLNWPSPVFPAQPIASTRRRPCSVFHCPSLLVAQHTQDTAVICWRVRGTFHIKRKCMCPYCWNSHFSLSRFHSTGQLKTAADMNDFWSYWYTMIRNQCRPACCWWQV